MYTAHGHGGGEIDFDGQWVTIRRTKLQRLTHGSSEKTIPLGQIAAVQLKPANAMVHGFIEFTLPGGAERQAMFGKRTQQASTNENAMIFRKSQMHEFVQLKHLIETAMARRFEPAAQATPAGVQPPPGADAGAQIARLWELVQAGALTPAEFEQQKARILGG